MNNLLLEPSFPHLSNDMTIAKAQIEAAGAMPLTDGLPDGVVHDMCMTFALYLLRNGRTEEAAGVIDGMVYDDNAHTMPPVDNAWLWLARMSLYVADGENMLALGAAENSLRILADVHNKKSEDYLGLIGSLLYNLAYVHNALGDNSRAVKELTKAQKLFERLVKKNENRFSALLLYSVEASASIIKSRAKQMKVFAHYQTMSEIYTNELKDPKNAKVREALENLVDTLGHEGNIMLEMGNGRDAVKYFTKALRYQKKLGDAMGIKELDLSIGLAKGLHRLVNRRAAAEQLLESLLLFANKIGAEAEIKEIENIINNKNKNFNIMTLLKSIFTVAVVLLSSVAVNAQLIVGHRGSVWGVENTEAAFINGAKAGAWGLECDIHTTKDGAFVICHDGNMKRLGGTDKGFTEINVKDVLATPLKQTRRGVTYVGSLMTLGEYLDLCVEQNVVPVIEIKGDQCFNIHTETGNPAATNLTGVPALIDLITRKGLIDKAVIISFMPETIEYINKNYPKVQVQVLAGDKTTEYWQKWCLKRKIDLDAVWSLITPELVQALHKAGLKVNAWTVDDPAVFQRMKDYGVDFITTNAIFPKELK